MNNNDILTQPNILKAKVMFSVTTATGSKWRKRWWITNGKMCGK